MTDKKELWVDWTHDALNGYSPSEDIDDPQDIADQMADIATKYADAMLEEYETRYDDDETGRTRKTRVRKKKPED